MEKRGSSTKQSSGDNKRDANSAKGADGEKDSQKLSPGAGKDQRTGERGKDGTDRQQGDKADVEELIKDLKNGNASARREAAKKLSDMKDRIDDPRLREAAEEALRQSEKGGDDHTAGQKGNEQGKGENEKRADQQGESNQQSADRDNPGKKSAADQKPGSGKHRGDDKGQGEQGKGENGKRADQQGESNEQSADRGNPGKKSKADQKPGSGKHRGDDKGQGEQGSQRDGRSPPPGNDGRRQESTAVNSDEPAEPGQAANREYQKRASALQLDDIKKKVNKDVLKKANMTEEEYQQFLKAYQEMQKRKESDVGNEEKLTDPKAASRGLRSLKSHSTGSSKGKPDDLQHGGASLPRPSTGKPIKNSLENSLTWNGLAKPKSPATGEHWRGRQICYPGHAGGIATEVTELTEMGLMASLR